MFGWIRALGPAERFAPGERNVVPALSAAAFFENYDYGLASVGAPAVSAGLGVSESRFGVALSVIRLASLLSIFLLRASDQVGRRRMLMVTLVAFTVCTASPLHRGAS